MSGSVNGGTCSTLLLAAALVACSAAADELPGQWRDRPAGPATTREPAVAPLDLCEPDRFVGYDYPGGSSAWLGAQTPTLVAVAGPGYLALSADGIDAEFSRRVETRVSAQGYLADVEGMRLLGYGRRPGGATPCLGSLRAPASSPGVATTHRPGNATTVTLDDRGRVTVEFDSGELLDVGRLALARFEHEHELAARGDRHVPTRDSGPPSFAPAGEDGLGTIAQGEP